MRKIFQFALEHATVLTDDIIRAAEMLDDEAKSERLIEAILGLDTKREDLADTVIADNNVECTLVKYNFLKDEVVYNKVDSDTKYFDTQENANKYANSGDYKYDTYNWKKDDEHPYAGTWVHVGEHYTCISYWKKWMTNNK